MTAPQHGGAVLEHALLRVRAGQEQAFEEAMGRARHLIARQPGFGGLSVTRCVEQPTTYLLLVTWDSVAAHEEGFRGSPDHERWRELLHHFYDPFPQVVHFAPAPTTGTSPPAL